MKNNYALEIHNFLDKKYGVELDSDCDNGFVFELKNGLEIEVIIKQRNKFSSWEVCKKCGNKGFLIEKNSKQITLICNKCLTEEIVECKTK